MFMDIVTLVMSTIILAISCCLALRICRASGFSTGWSFLLISVVLMTLQNIYLIIHFSSHPNPMTTISLIFFISLSMLFALIKIKSDTTGHVDQNLLRVEREEALKEARLKSEFLAVMSHEIRTPLNGIVGSLNLLKDSEGLIDEHREYLRIINCSSDSLLNIINDILDFSKIEAGKMVLEKIEFSLDDVLSGIRTLFIPIADDKGIEFLAPSLNLDNFLIGDPQRIKQIILNLVNNAMKFTQKGYVLLTLKLDETHEQKQRLIIEVEDSGVGIKQEYLNKIFESFSQEDASVTRKFGGTGLGLSISKKLANLMGGNISVQSEVDVGTTFKVEIDIEIADKKIKKQDEVKLIKLKGKVLLVEDNIVNQKIALKMLDKMDLEVDLAENGLLALEMVNDNKYDLILMDMMMPVLDGIAATEKIIETVHNPPPVVAMTANAFEDDRQKCFNAGMQGFITKPMQKEALYSELSKYLK